MIKKLLYILLFVPVALFAQDNYSLSFDGVDDYLEINNIDITHTNSFTWQIYIRFNQDVNIALFNQYEYYSTNGYYINYYDNRLCFSFASAGGVANNQVWSEQNVIQINNWNLLTVVKNEDSIYHYVNGVDVTSGNNSIQHFPESYIHSIENINIGWSGENSDTQEGNQWLKGEVDRISFWNTSLTDEEIQLYMMCPPTGQEDGLVGYWNFNEGLGDSLYDISGNGNQGTIYGATFSEDVPEETCSILDQLNASFDAWNISIDLSAGWNMFGYGCPSSIDVADGLSNHTELIAMVKDNNGSAYIPEFDFNGIGDLTPGFGYQIKVTEVIEGFSLCDWYVNDIPEDNIVSLQEENANLAEENIYLQEELDCYENPQVGDYCFGGIVLYFDEPNNFGLIIGQEDLGYITWYEAVDTVSSYTIDDYSDWYLPSIEELEMISTIESSYFNFGSNFYWSSSEYNIPSNGVWTYNFSNSSVGDANKNNNNLVRPIRAFGNRTMGCMDSLACNYNPEANMSDGSCEYAEQGYDCEGNITAEIGDYINYCSDIYSNISFNQSELNEYLENRNLFIYNPSPSASTFLFSPDFINSLNIINQNAFLVAFNDSIQISLPATLVEEELQSGQQAVYVYQLGEIDDGLYVESNLILPNDILTFKFINGNILYDIIIDPVPTFLNSGNLNPYLNTVGYPEDFDFAYGVYPSYAFGDACLLTNVGCTDSTYIEYLSLAVIDDGSCLTLIVEGCMDSRACNYNPEANMSDASCEYPILGYDCDGNSLEYFVGMEAEGGIVFYVDETGEHGLVAALEDLGIFEWGCYGIDVNMTGYGYSNTLGTGYQNTLDIVSQGCETENGGVTAAQASLDAEISGYNDWYLPSIDELNEMYSTIGLGGIYGNIGGYEINDSPFYWSSSADYIYSAYTVYFIDGFSSTNNGNRSNTNWVRVIRAF